jgi:hypothetical protein
VEKMVKANKTDLQKDLDVDLETVDQILSEAKRIFWELRADKYLCPSKGWTNMDDEVRSKAYEMVRFSLNIAN